MSIGFSPSDIIALVSLARKTYHGWKTACGDYADITSSLDGLLILLDRIKNEAEQPHTALIRCRKDRDDVRDIIRACSGTIEELSAIIAKYKSLGLGKSREKNWERICFGNKDLGGLKTQLLHHQSALSAYLSAIGLSSLTRIERNLDALPDQLQKSVDGLAAEIRAGRREGTALTTYDDDEKEVWKQFRRELIGDGLKSSFVHKYKPQIRRYLRDLAKEGLLEEAELRPESYQSGQTLGSDDKYILRQTASPAMFQYQATCETDISSDEDERDNACPDDVLLVECSNSTPLNDPQTALPLMSRYQANCETDSSRDGDGQNDACPDGVLVESGDSAPLIPAQPTRSDPVRPVHAPWSIRSLTGKVPETNTAKTHHSDLKNNPVPLDVTALRADAPYLEDNVYVNSGIPIASSATPRRKNITMEARASSPPSVFLDRLATIREETAHAWSSDAGSWSVLASESERWLTTAKHGAEPDGSKTEDLTTDWSEPVAPSTTEDGPLNVRASVTELRKNIFSKDALEYLGFDFHEFHDHFDVYDRFTEHDAVTLIKVHDSTFNPYAWVDLYTLTDHDHAVLDDIADMKNSPDTYWTSDPNTGPMTLLPQSKVTSAAISEMLLTLHRRMGGYYVIHGTLSNDEINNLCSLSKALRYPTDGSKARRAHSPTRSATCISNTKDAHIKPFIITTEGDGATWPNCWTTTWFPKRIYSILTMLALGCVIEQSKYHHIIRGASPKASARRLQAAVEMNDRITSAQALGEYGSLPAVRHIQAAWNDVSLTNDESSLYLWLCSSAVTYQGVWQICGPAPAAYSYCADWWPDVQEAD